MVGHPLRGNLAKLWFAAVICHILVTDNAKSDDLDLWPDLDLTCDLSKDFF